MAIKAAPLVDVVSRVVVNMILIDTGVAFAPPEGTLVGPDGGNVGDTLNADNATYARPAAAAPTAEQLSKRVQAEFARRITAALGDDLKQASMQREATALVQKVASGVALTDVEKADAAILLAINDWESAMVDAREALITAADATYATDAHWPPAPAAVTAQWLAGY